VWKEQYWERARRLVVLCTKLNFGKALGDAKLNDRQKKMINRLLDGFDGKLTTSKGAKIVKCSQDTAYRDILELVNLGILLKNPEGGRSTHYILYNMKGSDKIQS